MAHQDVTPGSPVNILTKVPISRPSTSKAYQNQKLYEEANQMEDTKTLLQPLDQTLKKKLDTQDLSVTQAAGELSQNLILETFGDG